MQNNGVRGCSHPTLMKFSPLPFLSLALLASAALAEPKPNVDKTGVALQGYDPVAFFTDGKPAGQAKSKRGAIAAWITEVGRTEPIQAVGGCL